MFKAPAAPALPNLPAAPPPPPLLGADAAKNKPKQKSMTPSFLGTQTEAGAANLGGKTLLGQ